jgi:hypothetical protein
LNELNFEIFYYKKEEGLKLPGVYPGTKRRIEEEKVRKT